MKAMSYLEKKKRFKNANERDVIYIERETIMTCQLKKSYIQKRRNDYAMSYI